MRVAILNKLVRLGFTEKVIFEQNLEGDEGVNHVGPWGKSVFWQKTQQCQSPKEGAGLFEDQQSDQCH